MLPILLVACNSGTDKPAVDPEPEQEVYGIPTELMDNTTDPCSNFFTYSNGTWLNENPIPETESSWSSFSELTERNNKILRTILEEAMAKTDAAKGSNTQLLGDFYSTAMDTAKLEEEGMKPILGELESITAISNTDELLKQIAMNHRRRVGSLFYMGIRPDAKKSDEYAVQLWQGGLGLPDRDFYFAEDERMSSIREAYVDHVSKMFQLMDYDEETAKKSAETVFAFEKELASASRDRVATRDAEKNYNKFSGTEFDAMYPDLNWSLYFETAGINLPEVLVAGQPEFFTQVNTMLTSRPLEDWKTYLRWNLINNTAPFLSSAFEKQDFDFYRGVLRGTRKMKPRWKRSLQNTNGMLGELLGQEFVKVAFTPETKAKADAMVQNLIASLRERLDQLDWMGDETKKHAYAKIDKLRTKIGYPDKWKDWSKLELDRSSLIQNVLRCNEISYMRMIDKMGKPINKDEWFMSPQTVNAYYNPVQNEIVFPAAILQPPFYDPNADDALNYGGIGGVIGHELTHGFDDQGNRYDADGNLNNWWTPSDSANFRSKADRVIAQFDAYEPLEGMNINGSLTVGENIADLGGLVIAYNAYQKSMEGQERKTIDELTPEQRFFLAWGQVWKGQYRQEAMEQQLRTNPHSPSEYRVIGPLSNIPEFYHAFGCSAPETEEGHIEIW